MSNQPITPPTNTTIISDMATPITKTIMTDITNSTSKVGDNMLSIKCSTLKIGDYVCINGRPCRITSKSLSKG